MFGLFSSIGFDAAYKAIFATIYAGACLDIVPNNVKLDMDALNKHFIYQGISHVDITTQVAKLLINQVDEIPLDVLFTGGEKLGEFDKEVNCRFVDGYGPTESYVEVATVDVNLRIDSSSIGHLVDNIKSYILDNEFRRVPIGAVGELYLSGYQVADGYLNRAKETDEAFINNPFDDSEEYNVLYRTGDVVRLLPDGSLGIVGRRDGQVKVRGNRVELSEVESVIMSMDDVDDVTVQTIKNKTNHELVAYVVVSQEISDLKDSICNYVSQNKPDYMVPSFIVELDEIPLNVNGKIDKKALPEVDVSNLHAEYVALSNEMEQNIVEAFEEALNQEHLGIYDDFIKLGGDSLIAIRLVSNLSDYNVGVADILSLRTPYDIARSINKNIDFDLDIYDLDTGCPLNEPQLNVYLDILANNKKDAYLIPLSMGISKNHSVDSINNALCEMFIAHPILGMCVSDEFEVPYLVKGSKPLIIVESGVDEDYILSFLTDAFDLHDSLCRFLIVENDDDCNLFAVFHHLIYDALSDIVFKRDLLSILSGESVELDDSFLKVSAYAQQIQGTDEYELAGDFYERMLVDSADAGILLDSVCADGPGNYSIDLELDNDLFRLFLADMGVSENVVFTGVFAYTLSRFVGSENVLFNIVENGRDRFHNYNSIGMYVNTLPLLVNCKNNDISSYMNHVSSLVYDVMKYNYYPFRLLANKYDIDSNIIFQFMPDLGDNNKFDSEDLNFNLMGSMDDFIGDFVVLVVQNGFEYSLDIIYSDKYSSDFVERFMESYKLILNGMLKVDVLSEIDYTLCEDIGLLDSYNQTEHDLLYDDILDAFNDNLKKYPDNPLVSMNDRVYSYGEGAFIADRIAKQLKDLDVTLGDCVGFLTESDYYIFACLGILSTGAAYVPLDEKLPNNRIKFILEDTHLKVLIVSNETYARAKELGDDIVLLNIFDIINESIVSLNSLPVVYSDLACILYTSGTTGIPKGVKITRKAILNASASYVDRYDIDDNDIYGLYASIGFDVASLGLCQVIYSGACLSVIPENIKLDIAELDKYFTNQNISCSAITTQVGKLFMGDSGNSSSLKVLSVGGEKLGEFESPENYLLADEYGPTEAFAFVSSVKNSDKIDFSSVGDLNYNMKAYVLDEEKRRVPIGAIGELYLSGYQIADGYLNREKETNEAFITNPFEDNSDYGVLYRTGDMVRLLPDGSLGIVGRRDSQVKVRGNRIELSEVESTIRNIDIIDDVTVQTVKNNDNNEVVAYVVSSTDIREDDLRDVVCDYVANNKPEYMIPSFVIELDYIPLTVNGKVDRRALPEVDVDSLHVEYVAATNETERIIMDAFETVFNQKGIGLFDDFVRLGGNSIIAIRLIALLEKNNLSCTATSILNHKTPYLIAQNIKKSDEKDYDSIEGEVDLHPIQNFFFSQVNKDKFTQEFVLKVNMHLGRDILQESLNALSNVHDMLRATYGFDENDKPIQYVRPINTCVCEVKEYALDSDDFDEKIRDIFINSFTSINISDNLMEVSLIHHEDISYVIFVIHHLIIDGVSWNTLLVDLTYIYFRLSLGKQIELTRPYPYKYWVEDVKNLVENISDEEKQHWIKINNMLDDSLIKGHTNIFAFNVDVNYDSDNLLNLTEEEYWAFAIARAYKKTFGDDIIFNRESHGRDDTLANLNRTIGWFTSQYPLLVELSGKYGDISLIEDIYNFKTSFNDVNNMGLNYSSLIYIADEMEYKHAPVTFNFLSTEFVFKNELFESVNHYISSVEDIHTGEFDADSFGISFNVSRNDDVYLVNGDYADGTYIGEKFEAFIENIKSELQFLAEYEMDNIICPLSEPQIGVYLDEKVEDKGTAYSVHGILECEDRSIDEIRKAITALIDQHPILRARVLDGEDRSFLVCDNNPSIEIVDIGVDDYSKLIKPFDLEKSLSRFFIIGDNSRRSVFYELHHLIADATSCGIIQKDFYDALNGVLDDSVDLGFVHSSYDFFNSKFKLDYKSAKEFFNAEFEDMDDIGYLLDDVDGSVGSVSLPIRGIKDKVELFAHENGITVSILFNSVFAYALSRFVGTDRVYYNFAEHGRYDDYSQDALGMFIRVIPIIVDCKNKLIKDYLGDVSDLILESMSNSIYPFRLLAKDFNLNNDIVFEYNADLNDVSGFGDDIVFSDDADEVTEFLCVLNDLDDGYLISVDHQDKFSQDTAERFINVFKEVLIQFLDKKTLSDIDYVSDDDIKLLDSYNKTEHDLTYMDLLDAFNDNLSKYPENKLISMGDRVYNYGECAFIANKIASKLIDLGVESQDCVAFLTERSEYYMFAVLAIMSMGGVYVPLDDAHPDDRINFILNDTQSKVIIVSDETYERANEICDDTIIFNIKDVFEESIETLDYLPILYGELACILYTSGTTGIPKGVKITRKSLVNLATVYRDNYGISNDDVYGLFSTIGFDAALLAMIVVLYSGSCLSIIPNDIRFDMNKLNEYFTSQNVTHTLITSQVGKLFMQEVDETSLDVLLVGGEKLGEYPSPEDYVLVDAFGPTEACVFISSIRNDDKIDSSSVGPLGYNTKAYVLDNELRRVSIGAVGELFVAGNQIADGYLNRDDETNKSFLNNKFDDNKDYDVIYRTGDMVRILPDGSLAIVGRRDSQVKIRGNRVELSEIESVIHEIEYVKDVAVQIIKNNSNHELVAYVVVSDEITDLKDSICSYVSQNKPDYMVPSFIVELDEIPLNVNGKIDKNALPEVDLDSLKAEYVAPTTENEKLIVDAFEKVFDQDKISIYDDFTLLGGDSLLAIRMMSYLGDYNVSAADILTLKTPNAIADFIKDDDFDLDIYDLESGCPLNESQLNVYLDIVASSKVDSYLVQFSTVISKEHELDEIFASLNRLIKAHPILEMCISNEFEVPCLVKGDSPSIDFIAGFDKDYVFEFLSTPFNLRNNLSRFLIVETENEYTLFVVLHHLISDALSLVAFKNDLNDILNGKNVEFDDSFLKVAAFNQQIQGTEEFDDARMFYDKMLAESDEINVLLDDVTSNGPGAVSINLDVEIDEFLAEHNVSANVLFTGVFAYTLSRFVGDDRVLFNVLENGRSRFNNFNSIGMFVNTLPLIVDCKERDVDSFLDYMSDLVYGVMKYNYYPFRLLANDYNVDSSIMFQYFPNWISDDLEDTDYVSDIMDEVIEDMDDVIGDMVVYVNQGIDNYELLITYSDKFSNEFIERFAQSYKLILHDIINVDKLSEINYITSSDLEFYDLFNQNDHDLMYSSIMEAFNDHLSKAPNNIFTISNEINYTYEESAYLINQIRVLLKENSLDSNGRVALFVDRNHWFILSALACISEGITYIPIDETYPDKRISFMIEQSSSNTIIITDSNISRTDALIEEYNLDLNVINVSCLSDDVGTSDEVSYVEESINPVACIIYTSGTTGTPKAVQMTRREIVNFMQFYAQTTDFGVGSVQGIFVSIGFDISLELFVSVFGGGAVTFVPNDIRLDLNKLNQYYIKHNVTHTFITTQLSKLFVKNISETSLRYLRTGGEMLGSIDPPEDYILTDLYGPAEYNAVSAMDINKKIYESSVGILNWNTKTYILDNEHRRVPLGAVGEIYVSGYQTTVGYLDNPEANAKVFFENPFDGDIPGYEVMYKTGDVARYLPDGTMGIVGRLDSQVKIRGNRVELSEVEITIRSFDYVKDVTVQTITHDGNKELVAYVVMSNDFNANLTEYIRDNVNERKPNYMVPSFVVELDEIPLTVNGKVDKRSLPDVNVDSLLMEYVAPSNETEKIIVEAFEKVFNREKIGIYDDFVSLGGDSLISIKLMSILAQKSIDVSFNIILDAKTPHSIASYIEDNGGEYGFVLSKKGKTNQNMFLIPPIGGLSPIFSKLIDLIDFDGNIYTIDDIKYSLPLDELKEMENGDFTLNAYYDAIKKLFNDGDIIVGYSLGCVFSLLLVEKLEKDNKFVKKCILIDSDLMFERNEEINKEDVINEFVGDLDVYPDDFKDKFNEVVRINSHLNFHTPKVDSPVRFLSNFDSFKSRIAEISSEYEYIQIDSTHQRIIDEDVSKIIKFFKDL